MFRYSKLHVIILLCSSLSWIICGEKSGDGCGPSLQGPGSGVLSSKRYPDTYPNNSYCDWTIRAPEGWGITIKFADLNIESRTCDIDHVKILQGTGRSQRVLGPFCGDLKSVPSLLRPLHLDVAEVRIEFRSGQHISGRGFLLSYTTHNHKDLLTCLDKGMHFSDAKYSKFCPAGCRGLPGDVSGDITLGYRHTSVLCKAAVHAGVISDEMGGVITVEELRGRSYYPAVYANRIQSKEGSLSDKLFTFVTDECKRQVILQPVAANDSSGQKGAALAGADGPGSSVVVWSPNDTDPAASSSSSSSSQSSSSSSPSTVWSVDHTDSSAPPWLQLDLGEKRRITGLVTSGSPVSNRFVRTYQLQYKDKNRWRNYTLDNSTQPLVFEGNMDSHQVSRVSLRSGVVTRHLRLLPRTWNLGVALKLELLGCPYVKSHAPSVTLLVSETTINTSSHVTMETQPGDPRLSSGTIEGTEQQPIDSSHHIDFVQLVVIMVVVALLVLVLPLTVCIYKGLNKKRGKETSYAPSEAQHTGCWKQLRQPSSRHQSSEFTISFSIEKEPIHKLDLVTSAMAEEYQQPLMIGTGTVGRKGSTFRPIDTDLKEESNDGPAHYDILNTARQYALPLTNQEPEYATPIIERHAFRKDPLTGDASYNVPGAVLSQAPSFKAMANGGGGKPGGSSTARLGAYQTPQAKADRPNNSEGVYDSPKIRRPDAASASANATSDYQRPQAKAAVLESYSTPRDCLRLGQPPPAHRPEPEGSSHSSSESGT